jgi:hypothetical protein
MALKFRRGTTAQQSGSLAYGEPYVNTTLGTLLIGGPNGDIVLGTSGTGSTGNFGAISGSGLDITGNANIAGNLTLGGNITIGDSTTDNIVINADLSSSLIPNDDNAFDVGSISKKYRAIYGGSISGSVVEINSGSNPELRLVNRTTGIGYHIQNGNGGNFQIHNSTTGQLLFLFQSASLAQGNQDAYFYSNLVVSESVSAFDITSFGGSISGSVTGIGNVSAFSSSIAGRFTTLATLTGSNSIRLTNLESTTASLNTSVSNLNTFSASENGKAATLAIVTASYDGRFTTLATTTGSLQTSVTNLNTFTASVSTASLVTSISNLNSYTASVSTSVGNINATTASLNTSVSNLNTFSASTLTRLTALEVDTANLETFSGSQLGKDATLATYTGSNDTKWSTLGSLSGSFARTNSTNIFSGDQTITGSLYVSSNLIVQGSSSIQNISSSTLNIGTNIITVAVNNPSVRFGGIAVIDSGSAGGSGSFLYDSVQDEFIFVHRGNGVNVTSSVLLMGPETIDNLGNETYLTNNRIVKGTGKEHIVDSQISDDGTTVSIGGALTVTGNITGPIRATNGVVSGSSQITYASISSIPAGIVSGSSQLTSILPAGVVSGSSQVIGILSSLNTYTGSNDTTNTTQNSRLDQLSTASGSAITRLSALEVETANLESFSSSALTRLSNLEGKDISITLTGDVTGTGTITDLANVSFATTIAANSVALGTDTTGDYVASMTAGTGITVGTATGEGSTPVITNTGVTSNVAGNAITVSGATGAVTINHADTSTAVNLSATSRTYVTALTFDTYGHVTAYSTGTETVTDTNTVTTNIGGTGVSVSSGTGNSTISIGQAVATTDNVRFNSLGIGMAASATAGRIDATNDIVAYSSSDIRFKENIKPIENALDKIRKISGNTYDWKAENKVEHGYEGNDVGVIAQEVEAVLPQLVQTRENGYKAVKYDKLVALLIEGIKDQQLQIEQLRIDLDNCRNKGL